MQKPSFHRQSSKRRGEEGLQGQPGREQALKHLQGPELPGAGPRRPATVGRTYTALKTVMLVFSKDNPFSIVQEEVLKSSRKRPHLDYLKVRGDLACYLNMQNHLSSK